MLNDALFSSDKNYWETPQAFFNALDQRFHFTLDAAASDENHKCDRYFTEASDGLIQDWGGRDGILQSTLRQRGDRGLDEEVL